jgi:hypothetical protein
VLEQVDDPEHRRRLRRIERFRAHDELVGVVGVIQLGEVLAACLVQHELDFELSHRGLPFELQYLMKANS